MKMQASETITVASNALIDLTADENRELQGLAFDISQALKSFRYAMVDLGKACIRAHEILAPKRSGAFSDWVETYTEVSLGWAYSSMRVYREFGKIAPGCKIDSKAMLLLASPSVPEEARQQAIEESKTQPVTTKRAKEIIDGSKSEDAERAGRCTERDIAERDGIGGGRGLSEHKGGDVLNCERSEELVSAEVAGNDSVDSPLVPVAATRQASKPREPNDIGERRFAVRSVVEQQTDGQPAYIRLNIRDLLLDLAEVLK